MLFGFWVSNGLLLLYTNNYAKCIQTYARLSLLCTGIKKPTKCISEKAVNFGPLMEMIFLNRAQWQTHTHNIHFRQKRKRGRVSFCKAIHNKTPTASRVNPFGYLYLSSLFVLESESKLYLLWWKSERNRERENTKSIYVQWTQWEAWNKTAYVTGESEIVGDRKCCLRLCNRCWFFKYIVWNNNYIDK